MGLKFNKVQHTQSIEDSVMCLQLSNDKTSQICIAETKKNFVV